MSDLHEVLKGLPTRVRLTYAACKQGLHEGGTDPGGPEVEEVVLVLEFSESGFGFGEITIVQTQDGVFVDTECMSLERVKKYLGALVDSAVTDNDQDPVKHARYNEVMRRGCGPRCRVCFPGV